MLTTKNAVQFCLAILSLKDKGIVLTYLIDFDHDVESMHTVIVVTRLAGATDFPVYANLKVVIEGVHEGKEVGRLAVDKVKSDIS